MTSWCLTTSPDNLAATARLGWSVQGVKSRRRRTAESMRAGDHVAYYVSGAVALAAVVEVTGPCFEDHEPVWTSKPGEDYPWRVPIRPVVVSADAEGWVPAEDLRDQLEFPRKWPAEHWKLAFQGNVRAWPDHDLAVVRKALEAATRRTR